MLAHAARNCRSVQIRDGGGPRVVLHADDLGLNLAVSEGIFQGLKEGLLTSASLLANAPHAAEALAGWKDLLHDQRAGQLPSAELRRRLDDPQQPFDLGIHLNLTQGRPLTADRYPAELLDEAGRFPGPFALFGRLCGASTRFKAQLEVELCSQIEFMLDRGLKPTHLNGHQYVEMMPALAPVIPRIIEQYAIPAVRVPAERSWLSSFLPGFRGVNAVLAMVKGFYAAKFLRTIDRQGIVHPDAFFGSSHAGCIDLPLIERFLARPQFSIAEIALHPGCDTTDGPCDLDDAWHDPLAAARPKELEMLLSPQLGEFLVRRRLKLGRVGSRAA
jgi:predicted glycoside hydrolase/deacetylase ChbG (UPF0249 family)